MSYAQSIYDVETFVKPVMLPVFCLLCRVPVIAFQQPAETFTAFDWAVSRWGSLRFHWPAVIQTFVRPLVQKMLHILLDNISDVPPAEENDLVETLSFCASYSVVHTLFE
jgi:hypothetical protein